MKHHVLLMQESVQLPDTWLTWEFNIGEANSNDVPFLHGLPIEETEEITLNPTDCGLNDLKFYLQRQGFTPLDFDKAHPELGAFSIIEIILSCAAIISVFQFKVNGLPLRFFRFERQDVMELLD